MASTSALVSNNASATLAAGINSSVTSLTVNTGQGALFPTPGTDEYFYTTLSDGGANTEVVKCTSRSGDTFTIVRAQDGTTAHAFSIGDIVELRPISQLFREKADDGVWLTTQNTTDRNYTIPSGRNAVSVSDVLISVGNTVTVPVGSTWQII